MLSRYRRYFAVLGFLLLATPLVAGLVAPDGPASVLKEGRKLAPAPTAPESWERFLGLPDEVDAYLKDHFGLREKMIRLHKDLTKPLLALGNKEVLVGRDGRMFYLGGEMVRQSAGLVLRDQRVADAAYTLVAIRDALARRGARFLVTVPPSTSTIYQDDLPIWAQSRGKRTEYDLFVEDLAARGVNVVDLRPIMKALLPEGKPYLIHDTHWTPSGALAGFNAVVEADSHPDWRLDPATALGPPEERKGGDLARMLGVQDDVTETVEPFALSSPGKDEALPDSIMPGHVVTTGKPGPTILVIGDSFTASSFPLMLAQHVGRVIWIHHHQCGFDWTLIDKFRPDEVWWAPTERALLCEPGVRPINFTG